ncbi:MAG: hypothetical protein LC114_06780 [Bryobacterales bacterium]|nr:hypothetical protein [Bryobacterales bacterium]
MKSTARTPRANLTPCKTPALEQRQRQFLRFIAQGESVYTACSLVGATRAAYEKWRDRHKGFREAVEAARESHRRDMASGLHTAEAYSRMLMDAIQRDEALPATLRYRAAKSILTRKGKKDWLPEPLPADEPGLIDAESEMPEQEASAEDETTAFLLPATSDALRAAEPQNPDIPDTLEAQRDADKPSQSQQDTEVSTLQIERSIFSKPPVTDSPSGGVRMGLVHGRARRRPYAPEGSGSPDSSSLSEVSRARFGGIPR